MTYNKLKEKYELHRSILNEFPNSVYFKESVKRLKIALMEIEKCNGLHIKNCRSGNYPMRMTLLDVIKSFFK